jgi:steroid delta-isomerase-like uncharacterized protein
MPTKTQTPTPRARSRRAKTQSPSDLARETFRILFEERDLSDPSRLWSDEAVDHFLAAGHHPRGARAIAAWFRELFAAVPDWRMEIENAFDDGERQAVVQWRGRGTFTGGPFLGIEANGRRVDIQGVDVMRFDDNGRVEENTVYYDGADFARQIGMLPPRDSALDRGVLSAFNAGTRLRQRLKRSAR